MSESDDAVVIIGGGQAAVQLCLALRKEKVDRPIFMLCEESEYPYHRPPLSKSYLTGDTDEEKLAMRPVSFYESKGIQVELGDAVQALDLANKTVKTLNTTYRYHTLVLATGARPRVLPIPGADLDGVHLLRNLPDSKAIKADLSSAQNIVIIGAGFIGLELAAVANAMQKNVTVFDTAERVMARAVSPEISAWFESTHRSNGIDVRLQQSVSAVEGQSKVSRVVTASGEVLDCDLLVVGVGVLPNVELAEAAGITCLNGIVVDEYCETSESDVYAMGDCASHPNPYYGGKMIRLESVQNATDQARVIASGIAGRKKAYQSVPWFWSDQGEHSLQMAGLSDNADQFVRRNSDAESSFSVFHFANGQLQSVDSINSPRDHMLARKLLAARVSPSVEQVSDPGFELKTLL